LIHKIFYYIWHSYKTIIMQYIHIPKTDELKTLCYATGRNVDFIEIEILRFLEGAEIILDDQECCGKTIGELVEEASGSMIILTSTMFGCWYPGIQKLFSEIVIMSPLMDCEVCGCEVEHEEDGNYGKVWTDSKCTNCGNEYSDEWKQFAPFEND